MTRAKLTASVCRRCNPRTSSSFKHLLRHPCIYHIYVSAGNQRTASASVEALSWTEYRRAVSELCPAFRRHGLNTYAGNSTDNFGDTRRRAGGPGGPATQHRLRADASDNNDTWEAVVNEPGMTPTCPLGKRHSNLESTGGSYAGVRNRHPPRSPCADSFHSLRRKRHAAVSLDYESVTKELPQVRPSVTGGCCQHERRTVTRAGVDAVLYMRDSFRRRLRGTSPLPVIGTAIFSGFFFATTGEWDSPGVTRPRTY